MAIRLLIPIRSLVACANGEWATTPSCASISAYNTLIQAHVHHLMHMMHIPTIGNTHFPLWAMTHYGILLTEISSCPSVQTIPPSWAIFR